MVLLIFQGHPVAATSPTGSEYNHALASNGGQATASDSSGSNTPGNAIDGSSTTYWQSSSTTGWLAVQFRSMASVNEIHGHFTSTVYSSLSLYLDTSGNGAYETGEKVWSTTTNPGLDVIVALQNVYSALGMKITIDAKVGSKLPQINEFEAYLRGDSDGDGLTDVQESSTVYYQDMGAAGMPQAIPDDAINASSSSVSLAQFYGIPAPWRTSRSITRSARTSRRALDIGTGPLGSTATSGIRGSVSSRSASRAPPRGPPTRGPSMPLRPSCTRTSRRKSSSASTGR